MTAQPSPDWTTADKAYQQHHAHCPQCAAAGARSPEEHTMSTKPAPPIILAAAILAGCAHTGAQYQPLVDQRTAGANYGQDLAECQAYATQRAGATEGAVAGAVFGALLGVALLAVGGGRGGWGNEAAAVGAVAGGLQGAAAGEGTQRDIIKRCMQGRGYSVLN